MVLDLVLCGGFAVLAAILFLVAVTNLRWMLDAWIEPAAVDRRIFVSRGETPPPGFSFSLIVPARHEEAVLGETLMRLARVRHPCFEVIVVVGHDDGATAAVAEKVSRRHPELIHVVVDDNWPKNKPKALNTALAVCSGDVVGVFDAEDEVAADLLVHVDACFQETGADIVQGGVQLMNYDSRWFTLRNVLEYFFYFHSRLQLHARQGFLPLGGNTVFFRRDLLDAADGWDPECLAEDCEIGVRLSANGAKTVVAYEAVLATREEAPVELGPFIRQRTRWSQGFLQVLRKGEWRELSSAHLRARAVFLLGMPFFQAALTILLPIQLLFLFLVDVPVVLAMASFLPLFVLVLTVAVEMAGLAEFGRLFGLRPRLRDYGRLAVSTFAYQFVLAYAAGRAVAREAGGMRGWEKTDHSGEHRGLTPVGELAAR